MTHIPESEGYLSLIAHHKEHHYDENIEITHLKQRIAELEETIRVTIPLIDDGDIRGALSNLSRALENP